MVGFPPTSLCGVLFFCSASAFLPPSSPPSHISLAHTSHTHSHTHTFVVRAPSGASSTGSSWAEGLCAWSPRVRGGRWRWRCYSALPSKCRVTSCHISCHVMSCRVVSRCVASCHVVSRLESSHSCCVVSRRVAWRRVASRRLASCDVTFFLSGRVSSCPVASCMSLVGVVSRRAVSHFARTAHPHTAHAHTT